MADKKISELLPAATPLAGTEVLPIVQGGITEQVSVANLTAGRSVSIGTLTTTNGTTLQTTGANVPLTVQGAAGYVAKAVINSAAANGAMAVIMSEGGTPAQRSWLLGCNSSANGVFEITPSTTAGGNTFSSPAISFRGTTSDVTFNTGNLIQGTAAKGINFTANTPAAGMTSQLLNWYEEGTWTPTQGGGLTVVGAFSSTGRYTRIGRQVTVSCTVTGATSVAVTAAGIITTNLPFTVVTAGHGNATNAAVNASAAIICTTTNVTSAGAITATGTITFSATYFV